MHTCTPSHPHNLTPSQPYIFIFFHSTPSPLHPRTPSHVQHLCGKGSGEIVKRWVNEAQEALSSDNVMVQYHALGLLYHIRRRDRLAVSKMVLKQIRSSLRSPFGYCLLVSADEGESADKGGGGGGRARTACLTGDIHVYILLHFSRSGLPAECWKMKSEG